MNRVILAILQTVPGSEKSGRANAIESLLLPVKGVYFPAIYDTYSSIIEFSVYSALFMGLAQATLGKRFGSRGGKAVLSAVKLALAIGLLISEQTLGFSLRSCAPLAAGTFIFLVGFTLYLGSRAAGMSAVNAASVALVMTYVSIAAVAPGFC